jgi:hypothetical protein
MTPSARDASDWEQVPAQPAKEQVHLPECGGADLRHARATAIPGGDAKIGRAPDEQGRVTDTGWVE